MEKKPVNRITIVVQRILIVLLYVFLVCVSFIAALFLALLVKGAPQYTDNLFGSYENSKLAYYAGIVFFPVLSAVFVCTVSRGLLKKRIYTLETIISYLIAFIVLIILFWPYHFLLRWLLGT